MATSTELKALADAILPSNSTRITAIDVRTLIYALIDAIFQNTTTPTAPAYVSGGSITGSTSPGSTLTAVDPTWTGADTTAREWYKNGVATGSTGTTYSNTVDGDSVYVKFSATNTEGTVTHNSSTVSIVAPGAQLYAYWLAKDTSTPPTESELMAGTAIPITHNQTTIAFDLTGLTDDKYLFLAEPIGEPVKTYKYASITDQEALGPDGQFGAGVNGTALRVYPSNFATSNSQYPIQLKTTA